MRPDDAGMTGAGRDPPPCPRCGRREHAVPIQYGYPTDEMFRKSRAGEIVIGGCIVAEDSPTWECRTCNEPFRPAMEPDPPRVAGSAFLPFKPRPPGAPR
jgi:hypothetical protein